MSQESDVPERQKWLRKQYSEYAESHRLNEEVQEVCADMRFTSEKVLEEKGRQESNPPKKRTFWDSICGYYAKLRGMDPEDLVRRTVLSGSLWLSSGSEVYFDLYTERGKDPYKAEKLCLVLNNQRGLDFYKDHAIWRKGFGFEGFTKERPVDVYNIQDFKEVVNQFK